MDNRDFNKIIIVSLCDSYSKALGECLSQNLTMMFCDAKDLVEYELIDKNALQELCTKEYLERSERNIMRHIASFVDVVVSISFDYLIHNYDILKENSLIVFVRLSKEFIKANGNIVNVIAFETREKELESICDLVLSEEKTEIDYVCEKLINKLGGVI